MDNRTIRLSDETVEVLTEHFPSAMRSRLMQIATTDEVFESPISCDCYCGESFSGTDEQEVRQLWARHAIEALSALPAVGGWLDIESAPKDGSEILGWRADSGVLLIRWSSAAEFLTDAELDKWDEEAASQEDWFYADFVAGDRLEGDCLPTHWQPLPAPPIE